MKFIDNEGGIRIRSDVQRHQLVKHLSGAKKYSDAMSELVYAHLLDLAKEGLDAGFPMIIDAAFLKRGRRQMFMDLAHDLNVPRQIINCNAPFDELCRRLKNRTNDPSEADVSVLKMQLENHDPLSAEERNWVITERQPFP